MCASIRRSVPNLVSFMTDSKIRNEVTLGPQGRVVIPASLRRAARFSPGDRLVIRQEGERIVLESTNAIERRLQGRFVAVAREVDLVAELIADRRAAAKRESDE